ncbi:MAG: thioredoxin-like domain-containing protein [Blastocatellia bacterium]|nr:thioredoxin-like domain-containing protein [Blastocatellia bacterium]
MIPVVLMALSIKSAGPVSKEGQRMSEDYMGKVTAPEFPEGLEWLNTKRPLTLRELRGKVVLLDFWTYCCINCMHILPELKKLERRFERELVVIGVHSAKFPAERETENIRQAILRYEIEHPVVNDRDMLVWRLYGARAWPTLVLIDPRGKIVGQVAGEITAEVFGAVIAEVIRTFDARGEIDRRPIRFDLERERVPEPVLSFPGKVLADAASGRLFIADSNHNRIVVASLTDGTILDVIGHGEAGLRDGDFETAQFNHPQGMALRGDTLYIADTENHAIREADLKARTVRTIAGTGYQLRRLFHSGGPALQVDLNSPWDLLFLDDRLYIAMAGSHQLWVLDLKAKTVMPYAGSGYEGCQDGPLLEASLAQPSGLTTDGQRLYVADSEASAIRAVDLDPRGRVETLVGEDLFVFGDRDGPSSRARLQHPLGVAFHEGVIYVADTYNNKIKKLFPTVRQVVTFLGTGEAGLRDGERPLFDEPAGISVANGKLYIADTNNHVIRVADLQTGRVATLELKGVERLRPRGKAASVSPVLIGPAQRVAAGAGTLTLSLRLPKDHKVNEQAPSLISLRVEGDPVVRFDQEQTTLTLRRPTFPISLPVVFREGKGRLIVEWTLYYCRSDLTGLCYFTEARQEIPLEVGSGGTSPRLSLAYEVRH